VSEKGNLKRILPNLPIGGKRGDKAIDLYAVDKKNKKRGKKGVGILQLMVEKGIC